MPLTFREINLPVTICKKHEENKWRKTIYITREGEGSGINQMSAKCNFLVFVAVNFEFLLFRLKLTKTNRLAHT